METAGQCNNQKWFIERCVRLHASKFGRMCRTQDRNKLAAELVRYKKINAPALEHGRKFENAAIRAFEHHHQATVHTSGIIVSVERPYLACSPDGLIDADALIEVKCPFAARNKHITPETIDYLYLDDQSGLLCLNKSHDYFYQVQGQLYVTGRKICFFVVYTLCDYLVIEITRDDTFICELNSSLDDFFFTNFKPALLHKFFYKNYYAYHFSWKWGALWSSRYK